MIKEIQKVQVLFRKQKVGQLQFGPANRVCVFEYD